MKSAGFPGPTAIIAEPSRMDWAAERSDFAPEVSYQGIALAISQVSEINRPFRGCPHANARKQLRSRNKAAPSAAIPATQMTSVAFATQPGATPTRRSRNGRKFQVVTWT